MLYQLQLSDDINLVMTFSGLEVNPTESMPWLIGVLGGVFSVLLFKHTRRLSVQQRELLNDNIKKIQMSSQEPLEKISAGDLS